MTNIASILKTEIARLARKEVRAEVMPLKKAASQYRSAIAALKREIQVLERRRAQMRLERLAARCELFLWSACSWPGRPLMRARKPQSPRSTPSAKRAHTLA